MNDPVQDIIQASRILFKASNSAAHTQTVLSKLRSIFSSEATARAFAYFCLHGSSTAWMLQCELNMPEATVYRVLNRLHARGIIAPVMRIRKVKRSKGGPRPTIWVLEGSSPDEVAEALKLHYRLLPPPEKRGYNIHTPRRKAK